MNNQDKKSFLNRYREIEADIEVLDDRINKLQSEVEKTTSTLSDMPKGGRNKGFAPQADKLIDLKHEKANKEVEALIVEKEISAVIFSVKKGSYRRLLERYYINCESFDTIATKMAYSYSRVLHMHSDALKMIFI